MSNTSNIILPLMGITILAGGGIFTFYYYGLSCIAGGFGSEHTPPQSIQYNTPINLDFDLVAWGASQCIPNTLKDSFEDVACHYKLNAEKDYTTVIPQIIKDADRHIIYRCSIAAVSSKPGVDTIQYYFDLKANAQYNRRDEKPIPLIHDK